MRRRHGYTLIELLVSMALILMIMAILSSAYISGPDTFSKLKGIGDMAEKLRAATMILRRDLSSDHFTGAVRLSDPNFCAVQGSTSPLPSTREGFFRVLQLGPSQPENGAQQDGYQNYSFVSTQDKLHFSVKLRGNRQENFFPGQPMLSNPVPPVLTGPSFFGQSPDASYGTGYQWGEVAYYLAPIPGAVTSPGSSPSPFSGSQQLYALYRAQLAVVANNNVPPPFSPLMSINPTNGSLNTPGTLQMMVNRGITIPQPPGNAPIGNLLLSDVLNFDVRIMPALAYPAFTDVNFDTGMTPGSVFAIQIIIRVYDLKSRQARQITLVQDL